MDRTGKHRPVMTFAIDDKELWLETLKRSGVAVVREEDGSRWIEVDGLFDFLARARTALFGED